jgi:hypothetical protein
MSTQTTKSIEDQLTIDAEERAALVTLLEGALGETRVEAHRTHTPDFRQQVLHHEAVVRRLLDKLRRPRP